VLNLSVVQLETKLARLDRRLLKLEEAKENAKDGSKGGLSI
jgi:hypothetical protein